MTERGSLYTDLGRRAASRSLVRTRRLRRNDVPLKQSHRPGRVTAISTGAPWTVTVAGKKMKYGVDYTPALGDNVIYLGGRDPVVIMKLKT